MSTTSSNTLPVLPTELLIKIFADLQVADLFSVQHTCHTFYNVISDSVFLQYILHTKINVLEDLLLPDLSLHDRVALLKHHEAAWNNIEPNLNMVTRLVTGEETRAYCHILQDGYLIYKAIIPADFTDTTWYGYMDLHSISDQPNAEARWKHITLGAIHPLSDIIFAVDHDLAVVIRYRQNGPELSFLQFTTGSRHPLSSTNSVFLPKKPEVKVFGDYILVTAGGASEARGSSVFSIVSWKTGIYTQLYKQSGVLRAHVIDPGNCLIALLESGTNCIHVCRLQFASATPCLQTLCFLRLPGFRYGNPPSVFMSRMEWVPTSKPQDRNESQTSRRRQFPFRSYRPGTIGIILRFGTLVQRYVMFVSVEALLSVVHSGVGHVRWDTWGPAGTRILPLGNGIPPRPAGPFWITSYDPLVLRDYNYLRTRYLKVKRQSKSSITFQPSLGPPSTDLFGKRWAEGEIETHLPYRTFVVGGLLWQDVEQVVADREWVVLISRTRSEHGTRVTVYHVG